MHSCTAYWAAGVGTPPLPEGYSRCVWLFGLCSHMQSGPVLNKGWQPNVSAAEAHKGDLAGALWHAKAWSLAIGMCDCPTALEWCRDICAGMEALHMRTRCLLVDIYCRSSAIG